MRTSNSFDQFPIIFTHVPRTAGTTLITILERQYRPDQQFYFYVREKFGTTDEALEEFMQLPEKKRSRLKVLQGHVSFGLHRYYNRYTYIALFRDPVERVVSYYYYVINQPGHYLHNIVLANRMRLEEFVKAGLSTEFDNIQTRQISGVEGVSYGKCTGKMLEIAKLNLVRHYTIAGLTERFDETVMLMKQHFGWNYPLYSRRNVQKNKPGKDKIPESTVKLIEQTNALDVELYRFAKKKFERLLSEQDESFHKELNKLKKYNAWLAGLIHPRMGDAGLALWSLYLKLNR
jgi:sulfotransferase famil protein